MFDEGADENGFFDFIPADTHDIECVFDEAGFTKTTTAHEQEFFTQFKSFGFISNQKMVIQQGHGDAEHAVLRKAKVLGEFGS